MLTKSLKVSLAVTLSSVVLVTAACSNGSNKEAASPSPSSNTSQSTNAATTEGSKAEADLYEFRSYRRKDTGGRQTI
jgi:hypothetical protein